jgi:hypothetical protein
MLKMLHLCTSHESGQESGQRTFKHSEKFPPFPEIKRSSPTQRFAAFNDATSMAVGCMFPRGNTSFILVEVSTLVEKEAWP